MKRFASTAVLCAAALVAMSVEVGATSPKPPVNKSADALIEMMDLNKDGLVSRDEAASRAKSHFGDADTNSDGVVTLEEWGVLHLKKKAERTDRRFAEIDTDGDGSISIEEYRAAKSHRNEVRGTHPNSLQASREVVRPGQASAKVIEPTPPGHRHFSKMDADGDGKLTADELAAFGEAMFNRLDDNGDGFVDALEVADIRKKDHRTDREKILDNIKPMPMPTIRPLTQADDMPRCGGAFHADGKRPWPPKKD